MDLVCDIILRKIESDRARGAVEVRVSFAARASDSCAEHDLSAQHVLTLSQSFPRCEGADDCVISVSGIEYLPTRDIVKTFVASWVEDLYFRTGKRTKCVANVCATADGRNVYQRTMRFELWETPKKNKRAINRITESVMNAKGLFCSMAS